MRDSSGILRALFDAALGAAIATACMPRWTPPKPGGRVVIVGAGKAAASMAAELETLWGGALEGLVIVPYGHSCDTLGIEVVEAAHPIPDRSGILATERIIARVSGLSHSDTVVCLLSGGGSSLLAAPAIGVSLDEKQSITSQLLKSGAAIHEINCVRKKLSAIKGGKLALAAAPADVVTLLISDVPGNNASMVASGPTLTDAASASEAINIIDRYHISISAEAKNAVASADPVIIDAPDVRILATADDALLAASAAAVELEITPYSLGDLDGDAIELAHQHAELALQIAAGKGPIEPPCVLLSGGETTIEVRGTGRGGRNGEYALALALALDAHPRISAIACDTDGIDGTGDNAGCTVAPDTLARSNALGISARDRLLNNDSYTFFADLGDLVTTGPTRTNVNDFRAILITD
ncbi:MAG: DUF4147 domain-containing protein [Gammaproteobacteria bacterium]|nr:DUF4147 domain-containing protein [Gammaproteobacteria bacterium]